jgi:hypothetical protein
MQVLSTSMKMENKSKYYYQKIQQIKLNLVIKIHLLYNKIRMIRWVDKIINKICMLCRLLINNKIVEEIKLRKIYQLVGIRSIELMIVIRKVKGKVGLNL